MDLSNTDFLGSSDFLKAADITAAGGQLSLVIGEVGSKEFTNDSDTKVKLTLQFVGQDKGIVLNITNTRALAAMYGNVTEAWIGKQILLTVRQTEMGPGIMVTPIKAVEVNPVTKDAPFNDAIPY